MVDDDGNAIERTRGRPMHTHRGEGSDRGQKSGLSSVPLVLICDDEPHISAVIASRLEESGYRVQEARDGQEGLLVAGHEMPVLIVTDLQMPRMNGLELALALGAMPTMASIPLVMVTGRGHYVSEEDLRKTNIRAMLPKPFSAKQLLGVIEHVLEQGREAA
jgi:CheY-like chemotaxis protein